MVFQSIFKRIGAFDLQGKVILILIVVIFPISVILGLAQSKVMEPVFNQEVRQMGLSFAQSLAGQIESERLLGKPASTSLIEDRIQRLMYSQPGILRVDVIAKKAKSGPAFYLASSVEDQETLTPPPSEWSRQVSSSIEVEDRVRVWSILHPVRSGTGEALVRVLVSLDLVSNFQSKLFRINIIAAILSTILLIVILSFLLRRAIENERQLRLAQESNAVLSGKLQEIQQSLIQTEKLAVMGQLTASFAHEIGTPLNSVSGHLQLLRMGLEKLIEERAFVPVSDRISIISGQIRRIEEIVKGFLATTKKPVLASRVRVELPALVRNVIALVQPSLQVNGIRYQEEFGDPALSVEVVPIEIEQVLLNLVNNAIYSMKEKTLAAGGSGPVQNELKISLRKDAKEGYASLDILDTGVGISEPNLRQIFKPFFTTKPSGEGHGLGLSICQEIIHSYGGEMSAESESGAWTRIRVRLPVG
jgi:signal transduction histidine kinase